MPGDTVGIIGKNGAGKSTLLKILSKITPPTSGSVISRGRIASLLEVGTGFHPELSGRENIFLNGSILGMKKAEIKKQFNEIIDFSGIEQFTDTPLKHYSSGMQLRLAFAVAAFLEPEILIIDEVLAVGDAEFQKKCMKKMSDISKSGRTILFVSHQLSSIDALCKRGVVLNKGKVVSLGNTKDAIDSYLQLSTEPDHERIRPQASVLRNIEVTGTPGVKEILPFDTLSINGTISLPHEIKNPTLGIVIKNQFNMAVLGVNNKTYGVALEALKNSRFEIVLHAIPLSPGIYEVDLFIGDGIQDVYHFENTVGFEINDRNIFEHGKNPDPKINPFIIRNTNWKLNSL